MKHVSNIMVELLARLYQGKSLDITECSPLTDCTLSDKVRSTTDAQEQEQLYAEYSQLQFHFKGS